ncbi:MAG: protein kinase domain-containing protein [Prochlorococcaceae cyanobacterium]
MMGTAALASGDLIAERYRLEEAISTGDAGPPGRLWRGVDLLAAEAPVALRWVPAGPHQEAARRRWALLQGLLHPQLPRFGAAIEATDGALWLVREWVGGRTLAAMLAARRERQLVFGAGEVLLLLRQLLPVLAVLHSQELVHGDLTPANLLRRDSDGLPLPLDYAMVRRVGEREPVAATAGYAPPEQGRGEPAAAWMDLHALGVIALELISGDPPERLLDPHSLSWRVPAALDAEPDLREPLLRLLRGSGGGYGHASEALAALQPLPVPETTGPVPRVDRTEVLVPPPPAPEEQRQAPAPEQVPPVTAPEPPAAPAPAWVPAAAAAPARPAARSRLDERDEEEEGGIWPVVLALVLSAVAGTAIGWWWTGRSHGPDHQGGASSEVAASLPPGEVDQREQLLSRLRALQVDRRWFLQLVDEAFFERYPERNRRRPSDALEDAPLRRVWNQLAEEWLARVEQLPLDIRRRLGSFANADWSRRQEALVRQGLSPSVLRQLVSSGAGGLLPGLKGDGVPPEPFRQLWYAAAELSLANIRIEPISLEPSTTRVLTAEVGASGGRLFPVRVAPGHRLVLGVNGTPLLQMAVFGADGRALEPRGPLRVVSLPAQASAPLQLLVINDGVAPAMITLSLRSDPPPPPPVAPAARLRSGRSPPGSPWPPGAASPRGACRGVCGPGPDRS